MADIRWDSGNKPVGYILGASPGFAAIGQGDLANMGFARKLAKAARMGFEFAMLDFEQLGEELEPYIREQIGWVRQAQNIEFGIHLDYTMDLTLADAFGWRYMQEQLRRGVRAADNFGAKFVLFHSSSHARPSITSIFGRRDYPTKLAGPDGTNLGDWIEKHGLKDWFMAKFIKVMFSAMGSPAPPLVVSYFEEEDSFSGGLDKIEKALIEASKERDAELQRLYKEVNSLISKKDRTDVEEIRLEQLKREINEKSRENFLWSLIEKKYGSDTMQKYLEIYRYGVSKEKFYEIYNYWRKNGSDAEEQVAYLTVAKYLYENRKRPEGKLWSMVNSDEDPHKLVQRANEVLGREAKYPEVAKKIVAAVAAFYIEGHLRASGEQYGIACKGSGNGICKSVYQFCEEKKILIYIETAMPSERQTEGELRIMSVFDHINMIKAIDGGKLLGYCVDFEHLLTNLIDPLEEAKMLKKIQPGDGKYITMIHVNAPRPIRATHSPLEPTSLDSFIIYEWMYIMNQAGMKNAYVIWETGSHGVRQSAIAFRNIITELSKNPPTHPKDLKPEFFGIDEEMNSRQMVSMRQHAFEPIRGMMVVPEEEWTMLSQAAGRRGKLAEWERRKYR